MKLLQLIKDFFNTDPPPPLPEAVEARRKLDEASDRAMKQAVNSHNELTGITHTLEDMRRRMQHDRDN